MPAAAEPNLAAQIRELGDLRRAGALTDAEFTAAKDRLISHQ
jgi:putative oligomerization/nucleic acid binding protein